MQLNVEEALRYAGVRRPTEEDRARMAALGERVEREAPARYVYRVFPLKKTDAGTELGDSGLLLTGALAGRMLKGCGQAALMACTLGAAFDALMRAAQARDMAEALLLDACGSAAAEAGCQRAEEEIAARFPGMYLTERFSPGYGDLPLTLQPGILSVLNAEKRLGVHAVASCLLLPQKTVTAVVGIADQPQPARIRGCGYCNLRESCPVRKGGGKCEMEA